MSTLTDTCGEIIQALADVNLLGPKEVELAQQFRSQFPAKPPRDLMAFLVAQGFVTRFQGDIALRGAAHQIVMPPFVLAQILGSGSLGQTAKAKSLEDGAWYALEAVPRKNILELKSIAEQIGKLEEIRHPRVSAMTHPSRLPARPSPAPAPVAAKRRSTLKSRRMRVFLLGATGLVAGVAGGVLTWWLMRG